jgi:hypothetical protein
MSMLWIRWIRQMGDPSGPARFLPVAKSGRKAQQKTCAIPEITRRGGVLLFLEKHPLFH